MRLLLFGWEIPGIPPEVSKFFERKDDSIQTPYLHLGNLTLSMTDKNKLSASDCGRFKTNFVVNGATASEGAHPWMVAIFLRTGQFCCGASIISERWIITAAHVFLDEKKGHGSNPDYFFVRVGSTDRMAGTKYEVEKVIPNDRFNENQYKEYDIALMRLKTAIVMGPNVATICLPEQSYSEPEGGVIVTGWGDTVYGNPSSQRALQQVDLDIFVPTKCAQMYIGKFNYKIFKSQFCTMNMNKDACQGDSGGPAIQIENGRAFLVGIVSYGYKCAVDHPAVFTKVSHFINWIQIILEQK